VGRTGNYTDLLNKPTIPPGYTLPAASALVLGGVKIGANVHVTVDGQINVDAPYVLPAATGAVLGGVIAGAHIDVNPSGVISVHAADFDSAGTATTAVAGRLVNSNNLSDLSSIPIAKQNLGLANVASTGAYADLTGRPTIPAAYTLPIAQGATLGGVKIGANVHEDVDGTISVDTYTLPTATNSVLGGVIAGAHLAMATGGVLNVTGADFEPAGAAAAAVVGRLTASNNLSDLGSASAARTNLGLAVVASTGSYADLSNRPTIPAAYTLPAATTLTLGGVKCGTNLTCAVDGTISGAAPYTLPVASASTLGGIVVGPGLQLDTLTSKLSVNGSLYDAAGAAIAVGVASLQKSANLSDVANPTLARGYLGLSTLAATGAWADLTGKPSFGDIISHNTAEYLLASSRNANLGVAPLDSVGLLPIANSPAFTGGDVTKVAATGVLTLTSVNGSAGVCGDATHSCQITTDQKGRVIAQFPITIVGAGNGGGSGGGTGNVTGTSLTANQIIIGSGNSNVAASGKTLPTGSVVGDSDTQTLINKSIDASEINTGTLSVAQLPAESGDVVRASGSAVNALATVNFGPGVCGDSTHVCRVTTDGAGRVLTQVPISITSNSGSVNNAFPFTNQSTFTVTHNYGTTAILVGFQDTGHKKMEDGEWTAIDTNTIQVKFASPRSGFVVINSGVGAVGPQGVAGAGSLAVKLNGGSATGANTLNFVDTSSVSWTASTSGGITSITATSTGGSSSGGTGTVTHTAGALTAGQLLFGNSGADINVGNLSGDVSTAGSGVTTLAAVNSGSVGTFGSATTSPRITVDAKGRITSVTDVSITGSGSGPGGGVSKGLLSAIPSTCASGDLYFATDQAQGAQLYNCAASPANTWISYSNLGASGALTRVNGDLDIDTTQVPRYAASNTFTGAFRLNPGGARPSCSSSNPGAFWFTNNGGSSNDSLQVCRFNSGSYAWFAIF
jgi:hypothetical protein